MSVQSGLGIGIDAEDVNRFAQLLKKEHPFFERFFTKKELESAAESADPVTWLAGRYCAKEAISKAMMEMGLPMPHYHSIEVLARDDGCPRAHVLGYDHRINVSISHCGDMAIAFAMVRPASDTEG